MQLFGTYSSSQIADAIFNVDGLTVENYRRLHVLYNCRKVRVLQLLGGYSSATVHFCLFGFLFRFGEWLWFSPNVGDILSHSSHAKRRFFH